MTIWNILVVAFAVTVAVGDLRWRKIPRALTVSAFFLGLIYHLSIHQFWSSVVAAVVGLAASALFFRLGAIAGGDVKLIVAMGALLGWPRWSTAMLAAIFIAGLIALIQVLRQRALRQTLTNIGSILSRLQQSGMREHPEINVRNGRLIRAPFGVAVAAGTLIAMLRV